jgi:serine/threonine-protein phosphatase PP1 catalytic subunit
MADPAPASSPDAADPLTEERLTALIADCKALFLLDPPLLRLSGEVIVCGQLRDPSSIFRGPDDSSQYLFLGDYLLLSVHPIRAVAALLDRKLKSPGTVWLLRGGDECSYANRTSSFFWECARNYSLALWRLFNELFETLPISAVVNDKVFCVHGGLSPRLDDLRSVERLAKPFEVPEVGLLTDLVWSRMKADEEDQQVLFLDDSERTLYTAAAIDQFCTNYKFQLVCVTRKGEGPEAIGTKFIQLADQTEDTARVLVIHEDGSHSFRDVPPV